MIMPICTGFTPCIVNIAVKTTSHSIGNSYLLYMQSYISSVQIIRLVDKEMTYGLLFAEQ